MKWINVKDQEPPRDIDFLAYVLGGYDYDMYGIKDDRKKYIVSCVWDKCTDRYIESCNCSGYEHDREKIEITHWMPLPSPPKL
jgi:hypothetical protein